MKHLLILCLFLIFGAGQAIGGANNPIPEEEYALVIEGVKAKVFELKFNAPIQKNSKLDRLKSEDGVMHYYIEGQYNTLMVVIVEPWMTQDGILNAVKPITDGNFQIIGEEIKTLDEAYLTK